ncbi:MAG: tetratricopeptide repeat protein [Devosia sp.]|nr:tetratricopeptide repeat protein [Devosia sp.]
MSTSQGTAIDIQLLLKEGRALHQRGRLGEAARRYRQVLDAEPDHVEAMHLLGVAAYQSGQLADAAALLARVVALAPGQAYAFSNQGNVFRAQGRLDAAVASYDAAIGLRQDVAEFHYNRASGLVDLGRYEAALAGFDRALALRPDYAEAHNNRGNALHAWGRPEMALAGYDRALQFRPGHPDTHINRGAALLDLGRHQAALEDFDAALAIQPGLVEALNNKGIALTALRRLPEALDAFDGVMVLHPGHVDAARRRGHVLLALKRFRAALDGFEQVARQRPELAESHYDLGLALLEMRRFDKALESFETAISLQPDFAAAHYERGRALRGLRRLAEAVASFRQAIDIDPGLRSARDIHVLTALEICDWSHYASETAALEQGVQAAAPLAPFALLPFVAAPARLLDAARHRARRVLVHEASPGQASNGASRRGGRERLRIGYYSADFHAHATAYLTAGLFEQHDRERVELFAFSFGPSSDDAMRARLRRSFDRFIDVRLTASAEVARQSRELGIDIAVDLKGYTTDSRPEIFAHRAAPLQVNYLGFPGTLGAPYMDYIIADSTVIPPGSERYYDEKVVRLPHCYQVNDGRRPIAAGLPGRVELGLPATGFVFCCFNNNFKITPAVFAGWMRILAQVEGSVLWLLEDNADAAGNLRREAQAAGIDPVRLVFAPRLPLEDHLARHRHADLFLDTSPCNAHTTASDALWAGLPVLTLIGEGFAGRVAASLLAAIGLPELITESQAEYEALAVTLATDRGGLDALKQKLAGNRLTTPLFDTPLFARHIEDAYFQMHDRHRRGLPPDDLAIIA